MCLLGFGLTSSHEVCSSSNPTYMLTILSGACTSTSRQINIASLSEAIGFRTESMAFISARNNIVHELGHAFANRWSLKGGGYSYGSPYYTGTLPQELLGTDEGFAISPISASRTWRQHPIKMTNGGAQSEIFADMFLGWTFSTWGNNKMGKKRSSFMNSYMPSWINSFYE